MSETNGATPPKSLVTKLAEVMAEVERVAKRGRNDFHKYDYVTEADIAAAVRQHMAERHMMMVPSVEEMSWREGRANREGPGAPIATLKVRFTVYDGDTGETMTFHLFGEGQDSGDKATYKAMTGANKYALLKLFQIPTGDDPEREGGPPAPRGRNGRREMTNDERRAVADNAPYADREMSKGVPMIDPPAVPVAAPVLEEPVSFDVLMARRAALPTDAQVHIPTDEDMHAIPPTELLDALPGYIDAIGNAVRRRKLSTQEQQSLKAAFLGNPRAQLTGQKHSPFFVYALFKHMRTDEA